jgi:hypothetical protein
VRRQGRMSHARFLLTYSTRRARGSVLPGAHLRTGGASSPCTGRAIVTPEVQSIQELGGPYDFPAGCNVAFTCRAARGGPSGNGSAFAAGDPQEAARHQPEQRGGVRPPEQERPQRPVTFDPRPHLPRRRPVSRKAHAADLPAKGGVRRRAGSGVAPIPRRSRACEVRPAWRPVRRQGLCAPPGSRSSPGTRRPGDGPARARTWQSPARAGRAARPRRCGPVTCIAPRGC